ncbi:MAG: bifunctional tRNA (adenosine(37)-N6)-threonylcarbamoyltransferase complex ATPase subunit type 1 TsaE/phosphotransferase [Beijerinckiaceae bacterium]
MVEAGQPQTVWEIDLVDEEATGALAAQVASFVGAGDLIALSGDLGSGKTTFARSFVRTLTGDRDLEVPSPTYTLMQVYAGARFPIVHADLFRINSPSELEELGWEESSEGALVVVEWPERAGDALTPDRLDVIFDLVPGAQESHRRATLAASGTFSPRLAQVKAVHELLSRSGWNEATRTLVQGDASTRSFERLEKPDGRRAILMISPPRTDGPPVRYGKPYSAIARLAETIKPYLAINRALRSQGLSAPEIYAEDSVAGLALLEDLGSEKFVDANGPIAERYLEAVTLLATLHARSTPDVVPFEAANYRIPAYDLDALLIEVELLPDWYAPHIAKATLSSGTRATFVNLWRQALVETALARPTWTLRDYHSPNLIWLAERDGIARVGLVDFQDCVMGHPAYDVASLLQDARATVPDDLELKLLGHYARLRKDADPAFDVTTFARAYAILGAQRATKILGIFARLDKRDNKPVYLAHVPRVQSYLRKSLEHRALNNLRSWYAEYLPAGIA